MYADGYRPIAGHQYHHHWCLRCGRAFISPIGIRRMSHWCGTKVVALTPAIGRLRPETQPKRRARRVRARKR